MSSLAVWIFHTPFFIVTLFALIIFLLGGFCDFMNWVLDGLDKVLGINKQNKKD